MLTPGLEAAIDFVKGRRPMGAVAFGGPSVRGQIQEELERRRQAREVRQQQRLQQQLERAASSPSPERVQHAGRGFASPERVPAHAGEGGPVGEASLGAASSVAPSPARLRPASAGGATVASAGGAQPTANPSRLSLRASLRASSQHPPGLLLHPATQRSVSVDPARASRSISPSFALIERRAPSVAFGPPPGTTTTPSRRSSSTGHPRYSTEPGPGAYSVYDSFSMSRTLSTAARPPSAVFLAAPRAPNHNATGWQPSAEGLVAWQSMDAGRARDLLGEFSSVGQGGIHC